MLDTLGEEVMLLWAAGEERESKVAVICGPTPACNTVGPVMPGILVARQKKP